LKLHKTDEAVTAKIANNPALAKALTDPNLTPTQKQQQHLNIDSEGRLRTKLYAKRDDFNFPIVNLPFTCICRKNSSSISFLKILF
jgi:hypothetical protein